MTPVAPRLATMLLAAALMAAASGCDEDPASSSTSGLSTDGPLAQLTDLGGVSILKPRRAGERWAGSFGGIPVCLDEAAEVTIEQVRVRDSDGTVDNLTAYVASPEGGRKKGDLLFISAMGTAPDFDEPYARGSKADARGYSFAPAEGAKVTTPCGDPRAEPSLVLTFTTDRAGGIIREWEVVYTSDGTRYSTGPVPWMVALCGTTDFKDLCTGTPSGA